MGSFVNREGYFPMRFNREPLENVLRSNEEHLKYMLRKLANAKTPHKRDRLGKRIQACQARILALKLAHA